MIPKQNRFHGRHALNAAYAKGRTVRGEWISLRYLNTSRPGLRSAVVVSRKVSKSAVVRNRIRRRIYEQIRQMLADKALNAPADLVVSVFDERVATMPRERLAEALEKLLKKANLRG